MLHEGGTEGRGGPPSFLLLLYTYSNVVANLAPDLGPGGGGGGVQVMTAKEEEKQEEAYSPMPPSF